jgi:amino acid adenylation domain-containing protein
MRSDSQDTGLIAGFDRSAKQFPSRLALVVGNLQLTYLDLQLLAAKIASAVVRHERRSLPLIAILAHRSVVAYAGILGILAAGKGYVPLNAKFPIERTRKMLEFSGCEMLVVGKECFHLLPELLPLMDRRLTLILPEASDVASLSSQFSTHRFVSYQDTDTPHSPLESRVSPTDIAYLLFTSGSTGDPKGVPISHSNVVSYVHYACNRYQVKQHDRFSQVFDLTFDLSIHDMFACWQQGACLFCLPESAVKAPAKFIRDHQLTMWFSVPSLIGILAKMRLLQPGCFSSLRYSLFCGEPLSGTYASLWQDAAPNSIVENLYGPTEATIAISHYRWDRVTSPRECCNGIVPIGRMFEGQSCRVDDSEHNSVSHDHRGELLLSGSQVASGYWNDSEKTKERFVRRPDDGDRLWYRTGDVVRQDDSGCLHFLGRIDDQVKISGYRIELQEVEAVMRKACASEQVASVVWPPNDDGAQGLVTFVSGLETLDENRLLSYCRDQLPDYMVPRKVVLIDNMPVNCNGKIDKAGLVRLLQAHDSESQLGNRTR